MGRRQCVSQREDVLVIAAPTTTRRTGAALEHAIYEATLAELSESGYSGLAIDRVARRARLGRASIYRRWTSKRELVADTIAYSLPTVSRPPETGSVRADLLACFQQMHQLLDGPALVYIQALAAELHDPGAARLISLVRDRVTLPRLQIVLDILLAGVARGEIRPEAAVPILARTGPALLFQHVFMYGTTASPDLIEEIVDRVILPAARPLPEAQTLAN
jgi:AcrR family transcriptional regulator